MKVYKMSAQKIYRGHVKWNAQVGDGRKKGKCVGNGNVRNLEKKSESVNSEEREVNN